MDARAGRRKRLPYPARTPPDTQPVGELRRRPFDRVVRKAQSLHVVDQFQHAVESGGSSKGARDKDVKPHRGPPSFAKYGGDSG